MRRTGILFIILVICLPAWTQKKTIDQRVDSVLRLMTLDEKVGQLNQYSGDWAHTGPITKEGDKQTQIRTGKVGSMLNVIGVQHTRELQEMALQSRLKIPLLFGQDVIHGFRTTFPIPLAEAASWDIDAIQLSARIAATEAAASGIHWVFAPMVDIARDPRWGRMMEGAGEDPYLGSLIAYARVSGFQGKGFGNTDAVMACAKHFAAYGAGIGGRDYNNVDISERSLQEIYLPPFEAANRAGVATFMNSFSDINGIPATANKYLQRDLLKGQWKFKGFVVSDWGSVGDLVRFGFVKNNYEAAQAAIIAGCDMDMESRSYRDHLATLVKEKKVSIALVDEAVRRVLKKKFEMGLFDDPFRFCNEARERQQENDPEHRKAARSIAAKSIVLLQNKENVLPLSKQTKKIAFIGPFVKAIKDNLGFWSMEWPDDSVTIVSQWAGLQHKLGTSAELLYAKGCDIRDSSHAGFAEAVRIAQQADIVILSIGEARDMSGEAKSRSSIRLPGAQEELLAAIAATGKPIVTLINAGRPLIMDKIAALSAAVLYTWWLGSEAGNAIADVLTGDYNPSAKLPVSFPRTEGQIPIYYNHLQPSKPARNDSDIFYVSGYIDLVHSPQYPFGFGLSYSKFSYGDIRFVNKAINGNEKLEVIIPVLNEGNVDGEETVQLYIRDIVASVVRPVMELKAFKKVFLKKGEAKEVRFSLTASDLAFYDQQMKKITEAGDFKIYIGGNSRDVKEAIFSWKP